MAELHLPMEIQWQPCVAAWKAALALHLSMPAAVCHTVYGHLFASLRLSTSPGFRSISAILSLSIDMIVPCTNTRSNAVLNSAPYNGRSFSIFLSLSFPRPYLSLYLLSCRSLMGAEILACLPGLARCSLNLRTFMNINNWSKPRPRFPPLHAAQCTAVALIVLALSTLPNPGHHAHTLCGGRERKRARQRRPKKQGAYQHRSSGNS